MTIQELAAKYSDADAETLALIEKVLEWRNDVSADQASEFVQKIINILGKDGEVRSLENVREQLLKEISRLNVEQRKLKKERDSTEETLKAKQQWFAELEEAKSSLTALTEKESKLHKDETEMQRHYSETKRMVEELQQSRWLSPGVQESIRKIWTALPADELDKALTR
ncbi:MAG: hypothetical protein LBT46_02850 [Planctomycetaceae bacterium]|jgi:chromosome segregation ATPase|nr:hypothetical protein [Planctomycetaceae bacterium]